MSELCEVSFQGRQTPPLTGVRLQTFSSPNTRLMGNSSFLGAIVLTEGWDTGVCPERPHSCRDGYIFAVFLTGETGRSGLVDTDHPSWLFLRGRTLLQPYTTAVPGVCDEPSASSAILDRVLSHRLPHQPCCTIQLYGKRCCPDIDVARKPRRGRREGGSVQTIPGSFQPCNPMCLCHVSRWGG